MGCEAFCVIYILKVMPIGVYAHYCSNNHFNFENIWGGGGGASPVVSPWMLPRKHWE